MKDLIEKYLTKFKNKRGEPVVYEEIRHWNHKYNQKKKKKTPAEVENLSRTVLDELEAYGLISQEKNKIIPVHPFCVEATLSTTRTGVAFAEGGFPNDIFIPPSSRKQAKHRDRVLVEITGKSREKFEGKVLEIIQSFTDFFSARVTQKTHDSYIIELMDLPDHPWGALVSKDRLEINDYIVVEEMSQSVRVAIPERHGANLAFRQMPVYRLHEKYAKDSVQTDINRVILKYNLPGQYQETFGLNKKELKNIVEKEYNNQKRVDLTQIFTYTIDGKDAKDFDDAISLVKKENGYVAYVHIADVSFFVSADSDLNKEAIKRGNSYYLGNVVIPMLPPILSEEFCSLKPKTKRLAFTVEMHFDKDARLELYYFYKSIIFIDKRFTYDEAENEIRKTRSILTDSWELAVKLIRQRDNAGRIDLNISQPVMVYDKNGSIKDIIAGKILKSNRLIEEFMLSANFCAADFGAQNEFPFLYRNHPVPGKENQSTLNKIISGLGIESSMKDFSSGEIQKMLDVLKNHPAEVIFQHLLLRQFSPAVYSAENHGHWALKMDNYTHFTSPIRRYADLVVHRQIHAWLDRIALTYNPGDLTFIAKETSRLERLAMEAERALQRLNAIRFIRKQKNQPFRGIVTGFHTLGIIVLLDQYQIEGMIPVSEVSNSGELKMTTEYSAFLPRFQKSVYPGVALNLTLKEVKWEEIRLFFSIDSFP